MKACIWVITGTRGDREALLKARGYGRSRRSLAEGVAGGLDVYAARRLIFPVFIDDERWTRITPCAVSPYICFSP